MSLTLTTGNTLKGKAGTATAVTYTIFGDRLTTTDAFEVIGQGQLSTSTGDLLTTTPVAASTNLIINEILLTNTTSSPVTGIAFYINGTAAANQIVQLTIVASGSATYSGGKWTTYDSGGGVLGGSGYVDLTTNQTVAGVKTFSSPLVLSTGEKFTGIAGSGVAYNQGLLFYDTDSESLTFMNNDSTPTLQIGQEEWVRVINKTGSTIPNGSAVYINGADVTSSLPTIALAKGDAATTIIGAGLATEAIANNAIGYVTTMGVVHGLDTSGFTAGATVFISATSAGALTSTAPTSPNYRYRIGIVAVSSATVGSIHVTPSTAALGNGTANQVFGMNAAGTAQEVKTIQGTTNDVVITNGVNTITASTGSNVYKVGGTDVAITDGGTGVSTLPSGILKGAGTGAITAAVASDIPTTPSGTNLGTGRSIATTAPLTGGGDLSADRTLAISAATTSTAGSQSAIDKAKQDNFSAIRVNILDYGGNGNGSFNNDTALANAMAALPSGGIVLFPAGQFNHNTVFTASGNNILWQGAGANATVLHFTGTTGDQLTISGYGSGIADMTVQGPGSGTTSSKVSGYGVNLTGTETYANNLEFTYQYNCIGINGSLSEIDHVLCRYYGNSGAVVNQNSDHRINRLFTDNAIATLPTGAGIDVQVTASLLLSNCNIIHANWCLNVSPGAGVTIPSVKGLNCFFDSSAIGLRAAGAGSFFRSEFTNCWFSSMSTAGILFAPTTAGANVDGITFMNCDIYNNVAGTTNGVSVTTANVGKWKMIGCSIAGWTNGINLVAGAAHYPTIEGNTIGSVSAFGVNTTGITIGAGAYGGLVIVNNDANDNTTAVSLGAVTITGSAYSKYVISSNPGINPRSTSLAPAAPASTVVVTNTTGFRVFVRVKWGATTAPTVVAVNGVGVAVPAAAAADSYILDPGGTFNYTGTVAMASWVWSGM